MKLGAVKVALFYNLDIAILMADVNKFLNGQVVVGPPAYAAGFVGEKELVSIEFRTDGATFSAMIAYTE